MKKCLLKNYNCGNCFSVKHNHCISERECIWQDEEEIKKLFEERNVDLKSEQ